MKAYSLPYRCPATLLDAQRRLIWRMGMAKALRYLKLVIADRLRWKRDTEGYIAQRPHLDVATAAKLRHLAYQDRIHPRYYDYFDLSQAARWEQRHHFLYHNSLKPFLAYINRDACAQVLSDKHQFRLHSREQGLNMAKWMGSSSQGVCTWSVAPPWDDAQDFILKPHFGAKGKGVAVFRSASSTHYTDLMTGSLVPVTALEAHLQHHYFEVADYIVESCLTNHPSIDPLTNGMLAVVRILSIQDAHGVVSLCRPMIQLPKGGAVLSHHHRDSAFISIDLASGELGAYLWQRSQGVALAKDWPQGFALPHWDEVCQLARRAHRSLPALGLVGWDIAITPRGAVCLEGNVGPSLDIHQLNPYGPLCDDAFYGHFLTLLR